MKGLSLAVRAFVLSIIWFTVSAAPSSASAERIGGLRPITSNDLVELRDVEGFVASPDGRYLAFHLRVADIALNDYEAQWYILDIHSGGAPVSVGDAGRIGPRANMDGFKVGTLRPTSAAKWSPDSRYIAYLKEKNGEIQLWLSDVKTRVQRQLTHNASDLVDFWWDSGGAGLYFTTFQYTRGQRIENEISDAADGYLYDQRFTPQYSVTPRSIRQVSGQIWVFDLTASKERIATPAESKEHERLSTAVTLDGFPNARNVSLASNAPQAAWAQPLDLHEDGAVPIHPMVRLMAGPIGRPEEAKECTDLACSGLIYDIWPNADATEVYFSRREGHNNTNFGYYSWNTVDATVRPLFSRKDEWLTNCTKSSDSLVCAYETPVAPRQVAEVQLLDGSFRILYNPNPHFEKIQMGEVRRINWTNENAPWAKEAFAHLVLPTDYESSKKYPLVITQYYSQGFLRGGVGDEYPVHLFAANGIAVLSVERPIPWEMTTVISDPEELQRKMFTSIPNDWDIGLQSIESGLNAAIATGLIDSKRVGITGLSDGAVKAFHALVTSDRYAAASVSGTGWDPILFFTTDFEHRRMLKSYGFRDPYALGETLWRQVSPIHNIDRINAPILLQVSDHELVHAAQTITMLSERGKKYEAYVFPAEYHKKWQPQHRYAIYNRNVDWFMFWFLNHEDPADEKADQYHRWRELRRTSQQSMN